MKFIQLLFCMCIATGAVAQQTPVTSPAGGTPAESVPSAIHGCLTDILHRQQLQHTPGYGRRIQQMENGILQTAGLPRGGLLVVPVVVHIIHNYGAENISDAQVIRGIDDLNYIFSHANPQNTHTNIQFCLARQNPAGQYTTGINRVVSPLTNMTAETQDLELKNLIRWDPTRYLNIWLVNEIVSLTMGPGIAGFAYFPASHGTPIDGIVNEAALFGSNLNNSKVHTHEVGHYLGLYHTFEGGCANANCQTDGDHICDTPPDNSTAAVYCNTPPNTCTTDSDDLSANNPFRPVANGGLGDQPDMIQNYMDYGYQYCQDRFTQGQIDRMYTALSTQRASLLQTMGCLSPCPNPIDAHFTAGATTIFAGESITFTLQNPTPGATYTWTVNGTPAGSGNPAMVYNQFNQIGGYTVNVSGSNGDPACATSYGIRVHVVCESQASFTFASGPYVPGTTITAANTSQNATHYSWYLDGVLLNHNTHFSQTFNTAGGHNLFLVADNGTCADTSATKFFTVGNCTLSGMNNNLVFNNISLNFSGGEPVAGTSPITNVSQESTTTISDPDGNLLFFSDGIKVWNRNHGVMPNGTGLMGNISATQSSLAVPFPGNPNRYYLFTVPAYENHFEDGVRYSIIDMSLNGGLGDVMPTAKNVLVRDDAGEMLSGTFHANGHDIWITMSKFSGNTYYSYLLTSQGLSTMPVVSVLGTGNNNGLGPLKFSPDGNKMATATVDYPRTILLADFNRATGAFMNPYNIEINADGSNTQPFSVEFSADNSKLYMSSFSPSELWQYNLAAGTPSAIAASKYVVHSGPHGQMCRGNNGKIYTPFLATQKLDYIAQPNLAGAACGYTQGTISTGTAPFSMPNMMQGLGQAYIPSINGKAALCPGEQVTYNVPYLTADQSVAWVYTGSGTLVNNGNRTATLSNLNGTGTLSITVTGNCGIMRDTLRVATVLPRQVSLGNDTALCGDLYLFPQPTFSHYLWSTGSIATSILAPSPGTYWVQTTDANGCTDRDTVVLTSLSNIPPVNLGPNATLCNGNTLTLDAGPGYESYLWQNGSTAQTLPVNQPGVYSVTVSDGCGTTTDSLTVTQGGVVFDLTYNGSGNVCQSALPFTLTAPSGYQTYLWQNGSTSQSIYITSLGTYYVTVKDANGCKGTDTLHVRTCAGIDENVQVPVALYPTPADGSIQIVLNGNAPVTLTLYNASGRAVYTSRISQNATVNTEAYASGVYMAEVRGGDNRIWHQKLIILH